MLKDSSWDTHIKAVKEVVSRLLVLQEQFKIPKNLKRYKNIFSQPNLRQITSLTSELSLGQWWVWILFLLED